MIDRTHPLTIAPRRDRERQPRLGSLRSAIRQRRRPQADATHRRVAPRELPFAGARMLRDLLRTEGFAVGRKHMTTLMRGMGITAFYRKPNTSKKAAGHTIWPYLPRTLAITRSNRVWAMDISCIPMARGFVYLAAVSDWHRRRVLAWRLSISMDTAFCTEAVEEAIAKYSTPEILITDQGSQVHQQRVHRLAARTRHPDLEGREGLLARQRVHRTRVALDRVRGGLPACLRDGKRRPRRHRPLHQFLQHAPAALEPSSSNPGHGVLHAAASAFGRSSLTPQGPLENLRHLFRSMAPALVGGPADRNRTCICRLGGGRSVH